MFKRLYDQEIKLNKSKLLDSIKHAIKGVKGIKKIEGWDYSPTSMLTGTYEISKTYPDKGHGSFVMLAMPVPTNLLNLTIVEGTWLQASSGNEVVLNQGARTAEMKIGDEIPLTIHGKSFQWKIVGFSEDLGSPATAYVSLDTFSSLSKTSNRVTMLRIAYEDRSHDFAVAKNRELDALFTRAEIGIASSTPVWLLQNAVAAHMRVLVNSLLAMAMMMALVGTMGLMSTISMNVLERTREIGVMRAIGATPAKIRNLIVWEGLTIGALSLLAAFFSSLLLSYFLGQFIGHISFRTSLPLAISEKALVIWIVLVIAGSYIATILPARRANKVTTREALAYE